MIIICLQNFKPGRYPYLIISNNRSRPRILFPPFLNLTLLYLKRKKSSLTPSGSIKTFKRRTTSAGSAHIQAGPQQTNSTIHKIDYNSLGYTSCITWSAIFWSSHKLTPGENKYLNYAEQLRQFQFIRIPKNNHLLDNSTTIVAYTLALKRFGPARRLIVRNNFFSFPAYRSVRRVASNLRRTAYLWGKKWDIGGGWWRCTVQRTPSGCAATGNQFTVTRGKASSFILKYLAGDFRAVAES